MKQGALPFVVYSATVTDGTTEAADKGSSSFRLWGICVSSRKFQDRLRDSLAASSFDPKFQVDQNMVSANDECTKVLTVEVKI